MTPEFWAAIIGQTIIIIVSIVAAAIRNERRTTRLETKVDHLEEECGRIPGISRAVARLEGKASGQ